MIQRLNVCRHRSTMVMLIWSTKSPGPAEMFPCFHLGVAFGRSRTQNVTGRSIPRSSAEGVRMVPSATSGGKASQALKTSSTLRLFAQRLHDTSGFPPQAGQRTGTRSAIITIPPVAASRALGNISMTSPIFRATPQAIREFSGPHNRRRPTPGALRRGAVPMGELADGLCGMPSRRSYAARAAESDKTSYAAEIFWKVTVAAWPARSGCQRLARRRQTRRNSAKPIVGSTPSRA